MIKISIKGKVFISTKDILFIIASFVMLLFILDAFANEPRIGTYFLYVLIFFDYIYFLKMIDNYELQKPKQVNQQSTSENQKTVKVNKPRYFEA